MAETVVFAKQEPSTHLRVVDTDGTRTLWFDQVAQSRMDLSAPNRLITAYEQTMAAWQLFVPELSAGDRALLLGLGGGSAAKHLYEQHPQANIDIIESAESVAFTAYDYFHLPKSPRLVVNIDDAFAWVKREEGATYRVLLIDLFNTETQAVYHYSQAFLTDCLAKMQPQGVGVLNLWVADASALTTILQVVGQVFQWRFLVLPVKGSANVILFVFHPDGDLFSLKVLEHNAVALTQKTGLPMQEYLSQLIAHNHAQLSRCIDTK